MTRGKQQAEQGKRGQGVKQPATEAGATSAAGQQNVQANAGAKMKKPAPQQVQQVKSQHASFRAQPKPEQVQTVTFNQNHRIEGSDHWQGAQYQVFRSYHPECHDESWYRSHYGNVVLIGGGYYFFNNGYWFPAWGYNPSAQYYPYDGPIYAGHGAVPPDQVIAQSPPANANGVAAPRISLLLSAALAPGAYVMPNLVGQTVQAATQILQNAGMRVGTVKVTTAGTTPTPTPASASPPSEAAPAATSLILSQDPAAGQKIMAGSAVNFEVTR